MKIHPSVKAWDSLDPQVLETCARGLKSVSSAELKQVVIESLQALPISYRRETAFDVTLDALMGVQSASITARFAEHPFEDGDFQQVSGMARVICKGVLWLPITLIFGTASETVVEHERIHLCQWLNPSSFPLTHTEVLQLTSKSIPELIQNAGLNGVEMAVDLLTRIVCFKTWTELEAYRFAEGNAGAPSWEIIQLAQRSALPFMTLEQGLAECGPLPDPDAAMQSCRERFIDFCSMLEGVSWVSELLTNRNNPNRDSLHDALWWSKEEDECESMLGPIELDDESEE